MAARFLNPSVLAACLGLFLLPLQAEDWTTTTGQTYKDVQVLSHDDAYVTILHEDGGGRIPLRTLSPALQKRFAYDPTKAALATAALAAADQRDQKALATEKAKIAAEQAERQKEASEALAAALFTPPRDADVPPPNTPNSLPSADATAASDTPVASEPSSAIDDWDYGYGGYGFGGYSTYGYGGIGYRHYRGGWQARSSAAVRPATGNFGSGRH